MRTFVLVCLCLLTLQQVALGKPGAVSLDVKEMPLKDAVEALFKAGDKRFILDASVPNVMVTFSMKNAQFENALNALCRATGMVSKWTSGVYTLSSAKPSAAEQSARGMPYGATGYSMTVSSHPPPGPNDVAIVSKVEQIDEALGLMTLDLPSMNLREALLKVDPDTGSRFPSTEEVSPEASFYMVPKQVAASDLIAWTRKSSGLSRDRRPMISLLPSMVSVAAYRTTTDPQNGQWAISVVSNQASPIDVLSAVFRATRAPFVATISPESPQRNERPKSAAFGPKTITAQIINMSLDDVLESITPDLGLTYAKEGSTYFISSTREADTKPSQATVQRVKRLNDSIKARRVLSVAELAELAALGKQRMERRLSMLKDRGLADNVRNIVANYESDLLLYSSLSPEQRQMAKSKTGLSNVGMTEQQKILLYKCAHGTTQGMKTEDLNKPAVFRVMSLKCSWKEFDKMKWSSDASSSFSGGAMRLNDIGQDTPTDITVFRVSGTWDAVHAFNWSPRK